MLHYAPEGFYYLTKPILSWPVKYTEHHTRTMYTDWRLGFCLKDKQVYLKICLEFIIVLVVEFNLSWMGKDHKQINVAPERTKNKHCLRAKSFTGLFFNCLYNLRGIVSLSSLTVWCLLPTKLKRPFSTWQALIG